VAANAPEIEVELAAAEPTISTGEPTPGSPAPAFAATHRDPISASCTFTCPTKKPPL
jgi:hypothetical protein